MNSKQKEFLVTKIDKYKKDAYDYDKHVKSDKKVLYVASLMAAIGSTFDFNSLGVEPDIISQLLVGVGVSLAASSASFLIGHTAKRTVAENMHEQLQCQLEQEELTENDGLSANQEQGSKLCLKRKI